MTADRNLLFGVLALQNNFISRTALCGAFSTWVSDKSRSLSDILVDQGQLKPAHLNLVESLVEAHLAAHKGSVEQSLAAIESFSAAHDLEALGDSDLQQSLLRFSLPKAAGSREELPSRRDNPESAEVTIALPPAAEASAGHRFVKVRPHAQGGLGQVYVALDRELNREIALKEIHPHRADEQASRGRFVMEAEITGQLEHPGIVPVYALGSYADGRPFYAMRFIEGESLKAAINRFHKGRRVSEKLLGARAVEFRTLLARFIDVCQAVHYAHIRRVLHRDLKPDNIMLGKYGETLVVDWGLAKAHGSASWLESGPALNGAVALSPTQGAVAAAGTEPKSNGWPASRPVAPKSASQVEATMMGVAMGTPAYMSPEQAAGRIEELGPATDIYSLGATLYHLLTGKPPFEGSNVGEILNSVRRGEKLAVRSHWNALPRALEAVCLKAMAVDPSQRYSSAQGLAGDLEKWLADEPVTARRENRWERAARFFRQHRKWTIAAGIALLLVSCLLAVGILVVNDQRRRADRSAADANEARLAETAARSDADKRRQEAETARTQADNARQNAEQAHRETLNQLRVAQANMLAGHSRSVRDRQPLLSMLLALEAAGIHQRRGEAWQPLAETEFRSAYQSYKGELLHRHSRSVREVEFSPDSRWLATCGDDGNLHLVHLRSGKSKLLTSRGPAMQLEFSPMGRWLAALDGHPYFGSGSASSDVVVWPITDVPPQQPLVLRGHEQAASAAAFLNSDLELVTGGRDGKLCHWQIDSQTGAKLLKSVTAHSGVVASLAVLPDGKRVVSVGSDGKAKLWNLPLESAESGKQLVDDGQVLSLAAVSPNGRWLAVAGRTGARVWRLDAKFPDQPGERVEGAGGTLYSGGFTADSKWLVLPQGNSSLAWDASGESFGRTPTPLTTHVRNVSIVSLPAKTPAIVSGGFDNNLWVRSGAPGLQTGKLSAHESSISTAAVSPDLRYLVSGDNHGVVRLWRMEQEWNHKDPVTIPGCHSFRPYLQVGNEGTRVAARTWDNGIAIYGTDLSGAQSKMAATPRFAKDVTALAFTTAAADVLAGGDKEGNLVFWRARLLEGKPVQEARIELGSEVVQIAVSKRFDKLAASTLDGKLHLWPMRDGLVQGEPRVGKTGFRHELLAFSEVDLHLIAAAGAAAAGYPGDTSDWFLWPVGDGAPAEPVRISGSTSKVSALLVSPDSKTLFTGNVQGQLQSWRLGPQAKAELVDSQPFHRGAIMDLALTPDLRRLICASRDNTASIWELNESKLTQFAVLRSHDNQVLSLTVSADGKRLATGGNEGNMVLWDLTSSDIESSGVSLLAHAGGVQAVRSVPNQPFFVTVGSDQRVAFWRWNASELLPVFSAAMGRSLTEAERKRFSVPDSTENRRPDLPTSKPAAP